MNGCFEWKFWRIGKVMPPQSYACIQVSDFDGTWKRIGLGLFFLVERAK